MGKRILVCDDDADLRRILVRLLCAEYEVFEAREGDEALRLIEELRPDLVLLDMTMPGRSGLDTLADYARRHPSVTTLVLSGAQEIELAQRALQLGAVEYVTKPFDPNQLKLDVQRLLGLGERKKGSEAPPWRHAP
jgi:DNA-binding NtrC family response regulator